MFTTGTGNLKFSITRNPFHCESSISDNLKKASKLLKVAVIGSPNAGKSTVINQIVGRRVFAMSKKVHTTKCCARAVFNEGSTQIVFLDTPGLVSVTELKKFKLSSAYFKGGEDAIEEADLIGVVHDVSNSYTREKLDPKVLRLLHLYKEKESILLMNKVDTIPSKRELLHLSHAITKGALQTGFQNLKSENLSEKSIKNIIHTNPHWTNFSKVFFISALHGKGITDVRDHLLNKAQPGEWIFKPDTFTDKNPVKIIEEAVRSRLLEHLPQEIPYSLDVELEYLDMENEELITTVVLVSFKADRTQRLIIGIGGGRIKMIRDEAEQEIADTFLTDVHLQIVLKKKENSSEVASIS